MNAKKCIQNVLLIAVHLFTEKLAISPETVSGLNVHHRLYDHKLMKAIIYLIFDISILNCLNA